MHDRGEIDWVGAKQKIWVIWVLMVGERTNAARKGCEKKKERYEMGNGWDACVRVRTRTGFYFSCGWLM